MKFFVAKMTYKNGDRSHPWTLFAPSYADAVQRLETGSRADDFSAIAVAESFRADYFGRTLHEPNDSVVEHHDITWSPEA